MATIVRQPQQPSDVIAVPRDLMAPSDDSLLQASLLCDVTDTSLQLLDAAAWTMTSFDDSGVFLGLDEWNPGIPRFESSGYDIVAEHVTGATRAPVVSNPFYDVIDLADLINPVQSSGGLVIICKQTPSRPHRRRKLLKKLAGQDVNTAVNTGNVC